MTTRKAPDEIKAEVQQWLEGTIYRSTQLELVEGGTVNFIYKATLAEPLPVDSSREVIVKHGEDFQAGNTKRDLSTERCVIEVLCLKQVADLQAQSNVRSEDLPNLVVRVPKVYMFDAPTNNLVQEYLPHGVNLKSYVLKNFLTLPNPVVAKPQCLHLGVLLARWAGQIHKRSDWGSEFDGNKGMRDLKHKINYDWLITRIELFPDILEDAREDFVKVKEMAVAEREDVGNLVPIHGDYWTGNILVSDKSLSEGLKVFVVDWEMAQLAVPAMDHGQMLAELYLLWLYRKIDAALWMIEGYCKELRAQQADDASAFRIAIQIGCHLVCFGSVTPGWGTPEQSREVALRGKELIVQGLRQNRQWFLDSDLACLLARFGQS